MNPSRISNEAEALRAVAHPMDGSSGDHDALLELIGDAHYVLLGEASHGTHEFYAARADITRRLLAEKGFHAVAIEGDWPDAYRGDRPAPDLHGRTAILVDDGLATGSTMRVAIRAVRRQAPARVVVAAPVASREACALLLGEADDVVCAETPEPFLGVGRWYLDFSQTSDEEVCHLIEDANPHGALPA